MFPAKSRRFYQLHCKVSRERLLTTFLHSRHRHTHYIHDTDWPIGEIAHSPDRLYSLISKELVVNFRKCHKLVISNFGMKQVIVNAIVRAVDIYFVYSMGCLDILLGGGGL